MVNPKFKLSLYAVCGGFKTTHLVSTSKQKQFSSQLTGRILFIFVFLCKGVAVKQRDRLVLTLTGKAEPVHHVCSSRVLRKCAEQQLFHLSSKRKGSTCYIQ